MTTILDAARSAYAAGLCLLPTKDDGSKAPAVSSWKDFQTTRPTIEQMRGFDFASRSGFGVIAGAASTRRECWDFDCGDVFEAFVQTATACGLGPVVERIIAGYCDATPGGGRRILVTYPADVETQDLTLARRPGRDGEPPVKVLIELPTFAIVAPSNGRTHLSGRPYVRLSGGFDTIADYSGDERDQLFALARSFDQMPVREYEPKKTRTRPSSDPRPGDDFNQRASWPELLPEWTEVYRRGDVIYLRRPGKEDHGGSATINALGTDRLHVFTSSTAFEAGTSYSKFGAYTLLHHHGDFSRAALALSKQGYGQQDAEPETAAPAYARPAAETGAGQCVLAPLTLRPYSGWFQRGATHIIAGSSGAGKTTLILDLLQAQARGALVLGHVGARLPFLVLFADRGTVSNHQTLERMRIDPTTFPLAHLRATTDSVAAVQAIQAAIEGQADLPAVVFIEGADMLVEDSSKPHVVTPFVVALRHLAEHYNLAVILSVGSPKARPQEQYQLKRDQVYGSQAWSRLCDTIGVLTITGDGTDATRDLAILHRNAAAEKFHLAFADGRLVETQPPTASETDMVAWFAETERFTARQFRGAFPRLSGARAVQILDGYVALKILREKLHGDRTHYVFRRPTPTKPSRSGPSGVGQSHSERDDSVDTASKGDSVPKTSGMGHCFSYEQTDFPKDVDDQASVSLLSLKKCPLSQSTPNMDTEWDKGQCPSVSPRAREADDLPDFLRAHTTPDFSDPIGAHDVDPGVCCLDGGPLWLRCRHCLVVDPATRALAPTTVRIPSRQMPIGVTDAD